MKNAGFLLFLHILSSGVPWGILIMLFLASYLASTDYGWPSIFYFTGGIGLVWVLLWMRLGASTPKHYSFISNEERDYIESSMMKVDRVNKKVIRIKSTRR